MLPLNIINHHKTTGKIISRRFSGVTRGQKVTVLSQEIITAQDPSKNTFSRRTCEWTRIGRDNISDDWYIQNQKRA